MWRSRSPVDPGTPAWEFLGVRRSALASALAFVTLSLVPARPARAASLQPVSNWGASGVPTYISMYIYVPDKPLSDSGKSLSDSEKAAD